MKLAMLDGGHYLKSSGKETPAYEDGTKIKEAEQNYPIMLECARQLKYNGIDVSYTNTDITKYVSLYDRVKIEKASNADIFVSFHKNATAVYDWNSTRGTETWCSQPGYNGEKLAKIVQKSIVDMAGEKDRGIKYCDLDGDGIKDPGDNKIYVVVETNAPAILVELGFMTNKEDAADMRNELAQYIYACAVAKGICNYYGIVYKQRASEAAEEASIIEEEKEVEARETLITIIKKLKTDISLLEELL